MNDTQESLAELFIRDIDRAMIALKAYSNEETLWLKDHEIPNSAGNLFLHICGNLRHFIGAVLGESGYIRRRDDEFNLTGVKRSELLAELKTTKKMLKEVLPNLSDTDLDESFPIKVFDKEMSTRYFLLHLYGHLNYHLGQINYHRRLLDKS